MAGLQAEPAGKEDVFIVILTSRRVSQPRGVPVIDRGNALGRTVTHCIPLNGVNREIVSGAQVTVGSGGSAGIDARGYSLKSTGSAAGASVPLVFSSVNTLSMSFDLYWDAFANDDDLAMEFSSNFSASLGFLIDPNSGAPASGFFQVGMRGGSGRGASSFTRPSAAVWHRYAIIFDMALTNGGVEYVYVDGVSQALSAAEATVPGTLDTSDTLYIFSRNNASLFGAGRLQNLVFRANYKLSAAEVRAEFENPWQIYMPPSRQWIPQGGAATFQAAWARNANTVRGTGAVF